MILRSNLVETHRLGDLVTFSGGFSFKSSDWKSSGIPVIKIANVRDGSVNLEGCSFIDPSTAAGSADYKVQKGDLLMTLTGEIGAMGIYKSGLEARLNQRLCKVSIKKDKNLLLEYVHYFLSSPSARQSMWLMSKGAAQANISVKDIETLEIPVPPLDEQRRIVESLDEHLSRLDKALAELGKSTQLLSNFKESFTFGIVSGKHSKNLGKWQSTRLGQVAKWSSGGTPQSGNPKYYGGQIPWCVIGDLTDSTVTETAKSITDEGLAASSAKIVKPGTVLLAMYGASIGRTGISGKPMATNQAIACAVPEANVLPLYLLLLLKSQKRAFIEAGKGGAQPNISQKVIKDWEIKLPPLEEQKRLMGLVEAQHVTVSNLGALIADLQEKYVSLRRSLLNAAFTGDFLEEKK